MTFTLRVRIPGWAQGRPVPTDLYAYDDPTPSAWTVRVAGAPVNAVPEQGYVSIKREWRSGDEVEINLPMPVRAVHGDPHVAALQGRVAFERGPVVYCVEENGRNTPPDEWIAPATQDVAASARPDLLGGITILNFDHTPAVGAIPYYAWDNRGLSPMAVWLKRGK